MYAFSKRLHRRRGHSGHLVVGVEPQQVKRRILAQVILNPLCHLLDFVHVVADFGDNEVGEFDVDAVQLELFKRLVDGRHGWDCGDAFVEVWVACRLEIHRRRIQETAQ